MQVRRAVSNLDGLKQGLINLVEKALNHPPAATAIQFSVLQERNPLIFERFRRGRFESGQGGSGQGLAVARMLMRTIRGDVNMFLPGPGAPPGPTMGLRPMNAADPYHYPTPFQGYKAPIKDSSQNFEPAPTICRDPA